MKNCFIDKVVIEFLSLVYIKERGIWKVRNESLLKLMFDDFELYEIMIVKCVLNCCYILFVILD